MRTYAILSILIATLGLLSCNSSQSGQHTRPKINPKAEFVSLEGRVIGPVIKTEEEWKTELDAMEFHVLRQAGTERAFSGKYWDHHEEGTYSCRACELPLFESDKKFDSGTGWPSFSDEYMRGNVVQVSDNSYGMMRIEVNCARCGGHLGHVFNDGPEPTGLRYCINSVSLKFLEAKRN